MNYLHGPYVNTPPVLTIPTGQGVSPASGTAGTKFTFKVVYKDADNQRPYKANLILQFRDGGTIANGGAVAHTMQPVPGNTNTPAQGITYTCDVQYLPDQPNTLQPGQRAYYFEFIDDWGSPTNEHIMGETVRSDNTNPNNIASWRQGPYINANNRPVLLNGSVTAADGTSNVATLWTYKVTYKSADNAPPAYVNVLIGQVDPVSGNIVWDSGHAMQPADSSTIYTAGKDYIFQTKLAGAQTPLQYYYCFVASDGINVAQFDQVNSPSADVVWDTMFNSDPTQRHLGERLTPSDPPTNHTFVTTQHPLVGPISPSPLAINNQYSYPIVRNDQGTLLVYGSSSSQTTPTWNYWIEYNNGVIHLNSSDPASAYVDVQYLFGVLGPNAVGADVPPTLSSGTVTPLEGYSTDNYVFSVIYQDTSGPNGQMEYVHVNIDGVSHVMQPLTSTPNYKTGAKFTYSQTLTPGIHQYFFEASDGAGYALLDANGSSNSGGQIPATVPIVGPYVCDLPTLTSPSVNPDATTNTNVGTQITYTVTYKETNNEAPRQGYPCVYIDQPITTSHTNETNYNGTVFAVDKTTISDTSQNWTPHQFVGLPLQMTSGISSGKIYVVSDNTTNQITLVATDLVGQDQIIPRDPNYPSSGYAGDTFIVGRVLLMKQDPTQNNYSSGVVYTITIPGLGGQSGTPLKHTAHFTSITDQIIGPNNQTRSTPIRTTELNGPNVINITPPVNEQAPVLSNPSPTDHSTGFASTPVPFNINYSSNLGLAPVSNSVTGLSGYVCVFIDGVRYNMGPVVFQNGTPVALTGTVDYTQNVTFQTVNANGDPIKISLSGGPHQFYFVASDGYSTTRYPLATASPSYLTINVAQKPTLSNAVLLPTHGNYERPFLYQVTYTDLNGYPPDNDPDGGIPHPQLYIDVDHSKTSQPIAVPRINTDDGTINYTVSRLDNNTFAQGTTYQFVLVSNFFYDNPSLGGGPNGTHTYYFTASDGQQNADQYPNPDAVGPSLHVNNPPTLTPTSNGYVTTPTGGLDGTPHTYSIIYTDSDNDDPATISSSWVLPDPNPNSSNADPRNGAVYVDIDGGATGGGQTLTMTQINPNEWPYDYTVGVQFQSPTITLPVKTGGHKFRFRASDWAYTFATGDIAGPDVNPRSPVTVTLLAPAPYVYTGLLTIQSGTVTPGVPYPVTIYLYKPGNNTYNNDPAHQTPDYSYQISGTSGNLTLSWTPDANAPGQWTLVGFYPGDATNASSYSNIRTVNVLSRLAASIDVSTSASPSMGSSTQIQGHIHFDARDTNPPTGVTLSITATQGTHKATFQTTAASDGSYNVNWTPDRTGTWNIQTTWAGNALYAGVSSPLTPITVSGPSFVLNGMDMISIPLLPTDGFPDSVFSQTPAYGVAAWLPALAAYKIYSWLPGGTQAYDFPSVQPGMGMWIKSNVTKVIAPSGTLVTQNPFPISLDPTGTGWNLIGCPFATPIDWSTVQVSVNNTLYLLSTAAANGWVRGYAWFYDPTSNSYKLLDPTRTGADRYMRPWRGYWIRTLTNCVLEIPAPVTSQVVTSSSVTAKSFLGQSSSSEPLPAWTATLAVKNGALSASGKVFGVSTSVADKLECPDSFEGYVNLYFTDGSGPHFASYLRSSDDTANEWSFNVVTDEAGEVELSWGNLNNVPVEMKLTLVDESNKTSVPMVSGGSYKFQTGANGGRRSFHISAQTD